MNTANPKITARDPAKMTRASLVSQALKDAIVNGELEPGAKVNLDQLRARYGVSLSPMREAIARLVADKLVVFEDQRGYRIAPISEENLEEVTQLRADLEALALTQAIHNASLDWESTALAALHRLSRAPQEEAAIVRGALHAALISGCTSPMLEGFCTMLANLHQRYSIILGQSGPGQGDIAKYHAIVEAAVARNAELAPALLREIIKRTGTRLSFLMKEGRAECKN